MAAKKQVRIIKKVRDTDGVWRFVSLDRAGKKYIWDSRPGKRAEKKTMDGPADGIFAPTPVHYQAAKFRPVLAGAAKLTERQRLD
jgi:hypothetical protein